MSELKEESSINEILKKYPNKIIKIPLSLYFVYYLDTLQMPELKYEKDKIKVDKIISKLYIGFEKIYTFKEFKDIMIFRTIAYPVYLYFYTRNKINLDESQYSKIFYESLKTHYENEKNSEEDISSIVEYNKLTIEGIAKTKSDDIHVNLASIVIAMKMKYLLDEKDDESSKEKMAIIVDILKTDYQMYCEKINEHIERLELVK